MILLCGSYELSAMDPDGSYPSSSSSPKHTIKDLNETSIEDILNKPFSDLQVSNQNGSHKLQENQQATKSSSISNANTLSTEIISSLIKRLQAQSEPDTDIIQMWGLKKISGGDEWLDNDDVMPLLLKYLKGDDPVSYTIVPAVDIKTSSRFLTSEILQSIQNQLESDRKALSPFMIIPINFGNMHWATLVIEQNFQDTANPTLYFFDSLNSVVTR